MTTETDSNPFSIFKKSNETVDSEDIDGIQRNSANAVTITNKDADYYNMSHRRRGLALIFNHYVFDTVTSREGTEKDCADITEVLRDLRFDVKIYNDLKYGKLYEVLSETSMLDHSDADCLVVVVMTHGDNGTLHARDHQYPPDMLWKSFTGINCPSLAGKPKLFFIQACRGDETDAGVKVGGRTATDATCSYKIPSMADILVMFSAFPGHFSFRSVTQGSWFIQSLCAELKERARTDDILKILTLVNRRVAINYESFVPLSKQLHSKKQVGYICSTLTRLLRFSTE